MLTANYSTKFKKELRQTEKRGLEMSKIYRVMSDLIAEVPLNANREEHGLRGNYAGFTECHIESDWLLIYRVEKTSGEIYFVRTGSHSDLFE